MGLWITLPPQPIHLKTTHQI
ncbi:hypothetical protein G4B88_021703 [Cannabis sativa]|uniref:Uncharacterized protein n=1 Tax=Cannabis sativa TaxID=3483 RepID=A0A7J6FIH9_CANSA|nr:hypothetical protein G4B88_021703 [Cannabis sativa]